MSFTIVPILYGASGKEHACQWSRHKRHRFNPWVRKGRRKSLEEEMTTHSSSPVWRMGWTEEAGSQQSIGSQRVRHYWSDWAWMHYFIHQEVQWIFLTWPEVTQFIISRAWFQTPVDFLFNKLFLLLKLLAISLNVVLSIHNTISF